MKKRSLVFFCIVWMALPVFAGTGNIAIRATATACRPETRTVARLRRLMDLYIWIMQENGFLVQSCLTGSNYLFHGYSLIGKKKLRFHESYCMIVRIKMLIQPEEICILATAAESEWWDS